VNPVHGLRDGHEILRFFDAFALTRYEKRAYLNLLDGEKKFLDLTQKAFPVSVRH
jgi:hypothetical protein